MGFTTDQIEKVAHELAPYVKDVLKDSFRVAGEIEALKRKVAVTPDEAAILTSIPAGTLKNWRCQARGPEYSKEGSKIVYPVKKLMAWLDRTGRKTVDC